jgi:Glycosyl transferase family 2
VRPFVAPPPPPGLRPGPPPTFSIVIVTYQAAATIREAVASAVRQTCPAHEVIVVDDGSTDDTRERIAAHLDRVRYVRQDNQGAPAALNAGVRVASGDFISILDADDVYEPERIEATRELAIARPDLEILMTDAYLERDGETLGRFCEYTPFASTDQNLAIFERCFVAWPAVRRSTLLASGGFDESLPVGYDWECWIRMLHGGAAAGLVAEPLMRYRMGDTSLTSNRIAALQARVRVLEVASRLDLAADERHELDRFLRSRRRRAFLAETEQALREHRPDARRRAFATALTRDMPPTVRLLSLAAALAPRIAARRLSQLEARSGRSRVTRQLPGRSLS